MKRAIGYTRISDEDQSNWSLQGQLQLIKEYCEKNSIELIATFTDDGQSAKNFDRADWKRLEEFVKKNHAQVDMLLVMAWSRFSRNTKEALQMIEQLEDRYNIRIISIREPLHLHPHSPFFHHLRTQMIQFGELELNFIRDRTKFGIHQAQKSGRYISKAPRGYLNARNEKDEPIIVIDKTKAPFIKEIYQRFLAGETIDAIKQAMRLKDFVIDGNSTIQIILQNHVYMGYVKQISYYDDPEALVKGIHEAIIDEDTWWKVQSIFNAKKQLQRTTISDDFPMRGLLKCFCNKNFTAAFSKGKKIKVGYYKCNAHPKFNHNAKKLHAQFDLLLNELSLPAFHIDYLQQQIIKTLKLKLSFREQQLQEKQQQLNAVLLKIDNLEEKYLSNDIDKDTFGKWKMRFHTDKDLLQSQLSDLRQPISQVWSKFQSSAGDLANLQYIYNKGTTLQKQGFIRMVFNSQLWYQEGIYRTPYLMKLFQPKAAILAEKRLLIYEGTDAKTENQDLVPLPGAELNPVIDLLHLIHQIKIA